MITREEIIKILDDNCQYVDSSLGNMIPEEKFSYIATEILNRLRLTPGSSIVFDFETNFITCICDGEKEIYPKHLGDGGYDWCKKCDCPLGDS